MNSRSASPVPQFTENKPIPLKHRAYEEIGASFNGNEVKIRVPKTKYKAPKLNSSQIKLENACTCAYKEDLTCRNCDMDSDKYGPQNTVDVHLPDDLSEAIINRNRYNSEIVYNMQRNLENICKTCNITPKNAPKGVAVLKKIHEDKDIFILKIGKQTDEPKRTGNIEVELVTPKAPAKPKPPLRLCKQVQCEDELQYCMAITCHKCRPRKWRPRHL